MSKPVSIFKQFSRPPLFLAAGLMGLFLVFLHSGGRGNDSANLDTSAKTLSQLSRKAPLAVVSPLRYSESQAFFSESDSEQSLAK